MNATVVVSTYNQVKYVAECLESILSQDTTFEFNIIVSDDCSSDGTQEILKDYAHRNKDKIKLILRDSNVGAAANYVELHGATEGDIIFHMDGDDVMLPGKMQLQYDVFLYHPEVSFCTHAANYFSDDGAIVRKTGLLSNVESVTFFEVKDMACWGSISVHSSYAYRRTSQKKKKIDREFMEWFFAMDSLLPNNRGAFINQKLLNYRCNPKGNSYLSTKKGRNKSYTIYFNDLYFYFTREKTLRTYIYANAIVSFLGRLLKNKNCDFRMLFFLVLNAYYLRISLLSSALKTRMMMAPK